MLYSVEEHGDKIKYTDAVENVSFEIPREDFAGLIFGQSVPALTDPDVYKKAMANPIQGDTLCEIARKRNAKTASVIVSDGTRGVPTHLVSGLIIDELVKAGIKMEDILFIVAVGLHREANEDEYKALVPEEYYGKVRMISSNAFDESVNVHIGDSSRGVPIEVNREAYECDIHIAVGKVQLHGMAGFSGGRKSVLPGISSYKTIMGNHTPQMICDPKTVRGKLEDNPFHIEMQEAADLYRLDFGVSFVLNDQNKTAAVFAGDMNASFHAAVNFLKQYVDVKLTEKPDIIVITPGEPFNVCFYQACRPLNKLENVTDSNSVIAFYAGCPEGIQSKIMMLPYENSSTLEEAEKWMWDNWDCQMDDTLFFLKALRTGTKFLLYSPGVDRKVFEKMHCTSCDSYDEFMKTAYALSGKEHPRVMFYPMCQNYFTSF